MKEDGYQSLWDLELLSHRLSCAEKTDAKEELDSFIQVLWNNRKFLELRVLIVGDDDAYAVAQYAQHYFYKTYKTSNVEVATSSNAVSLMSQFDYIVDTGYGPKYDLVLVISHFGQSQGIKKVYDMCKQKFFPFVLFTGVNKNILADFYEEDKITKIISYFSPKDKTSKDFFFPMFSTLAPVVILGDTPHCKRIEENKLLLQSVKETVSNYDFEKLAKKVDMYPNIHIFYEWDTYPTALDLENKLTSSLVPVILHDKRNLSYGRLTALSMNFPAFVINLCHLKTANGKEDYVFDYDNALEDLIVHMYGYEYISIGSTAKNPCSWNLEAMMYTPFLVANLGVALDEDVSVPIPHFTKEVSILSFLVQLPKDVAKIFKK